MKPRLAWLFLMAGAGLLPAQQPPQANPAPAPAPAPARPLPPLPQGPFEVNGIAAKVNGRVITKNKVGFMLARIYAELAAQFPRRGAEFERQVLEARNKILQELIDREIILSEFKQMEAKGAALPEHVVKREIDRQIREEHGGNRASFEQELSRARMTMDGYSQMVREQLIVQAIRSEHIAEVAPPDSKEMAKEYSEVKLLMRDMTKDKITFYKIFLPRQDPQNPLATPETQLALGEQIAADVKAGSNIADLAKAHSRDAFAAEGGFQKDLPRTDLAPEFAAIIFNGKDGDLLGPLEDPAGFTIVKIVNIAYGPTPSLSDPEVKKSIEDRVTRKKSAAAYEKWIEKKRRSANIERKI
ncbi:SurA N-terminal domain-containing protein [Haloferula sp. BvORR071]|uniref:SurA N-terminal domain-containing protein n=1 Tax=Haloferula sp. BvORR071 TaxID=1396141 RepID=UPI002240FD09|nr:SurA N-terminal domain-containing protein [Haloferula sp. BvORR071]